MDIVCSDGVVLDATEYLPSGAPKGAVLVVGAMAVPQRAYSRLAQYLQSQGFYVLTFDYRGMGKSRRGPLRDVDIDVIGWGERDVAAAVEAIGLRAPGVPLTWLGHSLGGQLVGLTPNAKQAQRVVTIASGSGWWRENAPELKWKAPLLWYVIAPVLTSLFGYFPGDKLHMVGDLPRGVMEQWRRWCLDPEYVVGVEPAARQRFADVEVPIASISFTDDEMMSAENIASLHSFYRNAKQTRIRLGPSDNNGVRIGHFGFLREEARGLWERHLMPQLAVV